jgi:hypothetical protein
MIREVRVSSQLCVPFEGESGEFEVGICVKILRVANCFEICEDAIARLANPIFG